LARGAVGEVEWFWYHMGSGHHFATPHSPEDADCFFYDPVWTAMNFRILDKIAAEGFSFGNIREFADALCQFDPPLLPPLLEGSWNTDRSHGVLVWMGGHVSPWEDDPGILALAWRAREALVRREAELGLEEDDPLPEGGLEQLWRRQMIAESSDPLGWAPLPEETNFGRTVAEQAMAAASRLISTKPVMDHLRETSSARDENLPFVGIELFGGEGSVSVVQLTPTVQQVDLHLEQTSAECGIRFQRSGDDVTYCPSALERNPVAIRFENYHPAVLYLPLTNGFLLLRSDLAVIRVNRFGMVAARVSSLEPFVAFGVEGGRRGALHRWRFLLHHGTVDAAVMYANSVNLI
jgi:hypothetical protein